ncbi:uncharacterized protein LOC142329727 [Lycorma delicatula]|uniref:uncharacterized protein LOC142329727 n=1 Tax=Lycorma delicatula TaxID=130591 RepID=UPI003F50D4D6
MLIMNVKNNRVLLDLTFYKVLALLICQLDFSCTEQVTNKPRNFDYEQPLQQSSEIDNITESNETLSALETQNNKKQIEEINTTDNLTVTSNVSEKYDNLNQSNDTTTKNHIDSNINITNQIKETTKSDMTSQTPLSTKQTTEKNEILKRNHVTKQIKEITKSDMTSQNPLSTKQTTEKMEILKQNHINSTLNNIYKTVNDTNENKLLVIKGNKISYNINDIKGENNITEMKVNKSPTTEKISIQQSYHLTKSHSYNSKNNNNKEIPKNEVIGEKQPKKNILDILLNKNFNTTQQTEEKENSVEKLSFDEMKKIISEIYHKSFKKSNKRFITEILSSENVKNNDSYLNRTSNESNIINKNSEQNIQFQFDQRAIKNLNNETSKYMFGSKTSDSVWAISVIGVISYFIISSIIKAR